MKQSKYAEQQYAEQQIALALKQAEVGTSVEELCRKIGISKATSCNWSKKYEGLRLRSCAASLVAVGNRMLSRLDAFTLHSASLSCET